MKRAFFLVMTSLLLHGCSVVGAASVEEPTFDVLSEDGAVQVREYGELLVARTRVPGPYDQVGNQAFGRLAGFIFGGNQPGAKIAMTAPVLQEPAGVPNGQKIAMTAPVVQEPDGEDWIMSFVMPSEYTLENLPRPLDPRVEIETIPPRRVATIRFNGRMNQRKMDRYSRDLSQWIETNGYVPVSEPRSAGYNPPWTLPALRRNEIHIDIE